MRMGPGGLPETGVSTYPPVFVVDSQASDLHLPVQRKTKWARDGQRFLLLLVGLTVIGLLVEGFLIINLYQRTQGFSSCNRLCNVSSPSLSSQQNTLMSQVGSIGRVVGENDIERWVKEGEASKPFAHLLGASNYSGQDDIVQWVNEGEASVHNMLYQNGRLRIQKAGHYYFYSKVQLIALNECKLIQHKVMKSTTAYGLPIELMQSKSNRCRGSKHSNGEELWSSFLAGIFQLKNGDEIFVKVENIQDMRPGPTENFMGAFMVSP
ncbi:tumor necrosis factor ligand superfamily member 14 [Oryzias latipes]|uniref:THD domain-containing protein n=1 Tax=Oryzias latipes TaxID=8090 RepID=A0A3B3HY81_ORYLA|nr:tumor necrosis factor ligand superfamily member 14 [Oryzias latipes]